MKVNEAPERVYIHKSQYWGLMANEHNITKNGVEYLRTDAFIEKAYEWMDEHCKLLTSKDYEDFRKYMKGE